MSEKKYTYKFLILLSGLCAALLPLCLLVQNNLVSIGTTFVSTTILIYPLTCVILDIIAEVYGYKAAKQTLWAMLVAGLLFGLIVTLSTKVPAPPFWIHYDKTYDAAMAPLWRSTLINVGAVMLGQFVNIYAITKLRGLTNGRFFALRSMTSSIVGDTVAVVVSLSLIFSTRLPGGHVLDMIRNELLCMYFAAIILSLPGTVISYWLKRVESVSGGIYFNPFAKKEGSQEVQ